MYENEREVGEGLRASSVKRDQVFVTTKIWTTHFAPHDLERSAKESLVRLRLTEVDLLLLHWPNPQVPLVETLGRCAGQAAGARTAYRRVQFHRGPDRAGGGFMLGTAGVRSGRVPSLSRPDQGERGLRAPRHGDGGLQPGARGRIKSDSALQRIGERHRKTAAQICLRWLVQQGVAAIPRRRSSSGCRRTSKSSISSCRKRRCSRFPPWAASASGSRISVLRRNGIQELRGRTLCWRDRGYRTLFRCNGIAADHTF